MPKARNMIIDGYKKGTQLQMDNYGLFYIFNGRNPIDGIESYEILTVETSKDVVSTVGRGLFGSALFGLAGTSASLTGKENKIYTIRINYDDFDYMNYTTKKDKKGYSVLELDQDFYKIFMLKSIRTEEQQKRMMDARIPSKYNYDYHAWIKYNNLENATKDELIHLEKPFWDAFDNNPEANPILDCCRSINPKWEEYMKQQEQQNTEQQEQQPTQSNNPFDIKSKLQQLKSMYEEDLITEEEYNNKKQELLSQI